jgi:hypothetical protein
VGPDRDGVTTWPPARRGLAAAGLVVTVLTGATAGARHGGAATGVVVAVHVVGAVLAVRWPRLVVAHPVTGMLVGWSTLLDTSPGTGGPTAGLVVVTAGVVASCELLGLAGRLATLVERDPVPGLRRAAGAVVVGTGAAALTGAAAVAGGPHGLAATLVAAVAGIAAVALVAPPDRLSRPPDPTARPHGRT